jgi:hypothetical protein
MELGCRPHAPAVKPKDKQHPMSGKWKLGFVSILVLQVPVLYIFVFSFISPYVSPSLSLSLSLSLCLVCQMSVCSVEL